MSILQRSKPSQRCGPEAREEPRGEILRAVGDPPVDDLHREEGTGFDFRAGRADQFRFLDRSGVDPDKLPAGFGAGLDRARLAQFDLDPEFLAHLAGGRGRVVFAGVEVASGAAVPEAGVDVFEVGALLQEEFACPVEREDVDPRGGGGRARARWPGVPGR